jgi:hypothetical protein
MSFKVIDGDGPGKEEGDREREREWAQGEFSYAIRDCAANMLRIVRGAGKGYEILRQMQTVIEALSISESSRTLAIVGFYPTRIGLAR